MISTLRRFVPGAMLFPAWVVALVVLQSGCVGVHRVKVNAQARPDAPEHISYSVRERSAFRGSGNPAGVNYVRTALSAKGMYEADKPEQADLDVVFIYDIREKKRTGYTVVLGPWDGSEGIDYERRTITEISYEKTLFIVATEKNPAPGTTARVWSIFITDEDGDPSLEKAMPLLAAAGCDRIGTNTDGPITIRLRDKDEVVAFIKRGL